MIKRRKGCLKCIVMLITIGIIVSNTTVCKAADKTMELFSLGRKMTVSLKQSGNTAIASARVTGTTETTKKIRITMYLEKKISNGSWKVVQSWTGEKRGYYYNIQKKCVVIKGTYRVKAISTCYNDQTKDVITRISATKTF